MVFFKLLYFNMILRDSPPKRPLTAYFLFLGETRLKIVQ